MKTLEQYDSKIIFTQYLQKVLDHFAACFGIRIAFFDIYGRSCKVGMKQGMSRYCLMVREELGLDAKCLECDRRMTEEARIKKATVSYICHAGMREMIKPVYLGEIHIGYIMIGQFRDCESPPAKLRAMCNSDSLCAMFRKAPYYSKSMTEHITGIFEVLVDSTVDKQAYKLEMEEPMFKLRNYLFYNISRNVSLEQAAAYLNWSKSKLTHTVKKSSGFSFKQMQIEMKLEYACELIKGKGMTISEAASETGFHDPCYFSRIFKKYRGMTPVEFKNSIL